MLGLFELGKTIERQGDCRPDRFNALNVIRAASCAHGCDCDEDTHDRTRRCGAAEER
jgi:hypothetical protein